MADFKPLGSRNLFWWNLAWLTTSGAPPHDNFGGVALHGWSRVSLFLCHAARSHFLTDPDDL